MTVAGPETALLVATSEAEELLVGWRRRHLADTVRRGIPAHVTVLYPFVPPSELTAELDASLRSLYATLDRFEFALTTVESFPGHVWCAPEPSAAFLALIEATRARFPDYPLYGDPKLDPTPHCTVGAADEPEALARMLAEVRAGLSPSLPVRCHADAVLLYRERDDGSWVEHASYPLRRA